MGRRLRELVLWAGAALGLLAVIAGIAVAFFGFGFLVFRSGSMEPEIPTGGLALSHTVAAQDIRVGDVVSVIAETGERITHRVVSVTLRGDEASLVLKGDANATPDGEIYVVDSVERVVASVPFGGFVIVHALTPPGLLAVACFSLMLVVVGFGRDDEDDDSTDDDDDEDDDDEPEALEPVRELVAAGAVVLLAAPATTVREARPARRRRSLRVSKGRGAAGLVVAIALLLALLGAGAAAGETSGTLAGFTDKPTGRANTFTAAQLVTPTLTCTENANNTITVSWPAVNLPGRTVGYDVVLVGNGNNTNTTLAATGTGGTRSVTITNGQAPGTFFGARRYDVNVTARSTAPSWTSDQVSVPIRSNYAIFNELTCE